jgi:myo-inositol-1(or 4)-monophosphatase
MIDNIIKIVREAGKIMLDAQHIKDGVESKQGRANFVTKYDIEVQEFLFRELAACYPEATFVGEEDDKKTTINDGYCFIIDPIDGTTNFIFDYRFSAISVGLMYQNELIAGVVYNPYLNEMFTAEKGKGAFVNGRQIKVKDLSLSEGVVAIGTCPYNRDKTDETFTIARKLFDKALDIRRSGSAALDICYVAAGRIVLYYEMLISPWDHAGASVILKEAGGRISSMDATEVVYDKPCSVMAATPKAYEEYFKII